MKRGFALLLAAAALTAAGCGSDNKDNTESGAANQPSPATTPSSAPANSEPGGAGGAKGSSAISVSADPGGALKFDKSSLSADAGRVTIKMANPSSVPHGIGIEGSGVDEEGDTVNKGGTSTVTATVKPGKYEFYCPVPGHKQAGMEGTLTVK